MPAPAVPKLPLNNKHSFQVTLMELSLVCHHDRGNAAAFRSLFATRRDGSAGGSCDLRLPFGCSGLWGSAWLSLPGAAGFGSKHQWIQQYGNAESPSPCFGKAGLGAACDRHGPRKLGSVDLLAEWLFSKFVWADKPKSGGKAVLWHPRGMEHGNPGNDAPRAPLPPRECFAGAIQRGARNGSTWGLHAPVTPILVLLHPLLTFTSPQQQGEKGRQRPAHSGCLWPTVPSGGWETKTPVFAKYCRQDCERPSKRKHYPTVYTCSTPARPSRRRGAWWLRGHRSDRATSH